VSELFISHKTLAFGPWEHFERVVARLLIHKGWENVELVGGSGDKGADVLASRKGQDYVFQVKFSSKNKPIGQDIVNDVVRAMDYYNIDNGICVSNRNLNDTEKKKLKGLQLSGSNIKSFTSQKLIDSLEKSSEWIADYRTPFRYQKECLIKLKDSFDLGSDRGLISLATGMGKTYVACHFIKWLVEKSSDYNILVLAHKDSLLDQFERSLWYSLPKNISTHILTGSIKPFYSNGVLLSTFDSFPNWHKKNRDAKFDILVVDEAHHSKAPTYEAVINSINPIYKLGLTATPYRADGLDITEIFGSPLVYYSVAKGIRTGFLSEVVYKLRADNIDNDWIVNKSMMGHTVKQLNKKLFIPEREEEICNLFLKYWKHENRKRAIIFCQSVSHAINIENILRSLGFSCASLTTSEKNRENANRLRRFRRGELKALTTFDMLNEGVDVPDVDFICYLRVTHSRGYFLQQLGRGLRYKAGKTLLVIDFIADIRRAKAVKRQRDEYINEEEHLQLPNGFKLEFSNDFTDDFLKLVSEEIETEFLELHDIID